MKQFLKSLLMLLLAAGAGNLYAQKPASAEATVGKQGQALIDSLLKEVPGSQVFSFLKLELRAMDRANYF